MSKKITKLILIFYVSLWTHYARAQDIGLIVNEFSNSVILGNDSVREYIELLVVGCPGAGGTTGTNGPQFNTLNLRGWILDDDNGGFSNNGTDKGGLSISAGHIRFKDIPEWGAVPVGSIIMIYNDKDYNSEFDDDPLDLVDTNRVYILPISSIYFEQATTDNYGSATYAATDTLSWAKLKLRNEGDGVQTRKPTDATLTSYTFFHGLSYGDISGSPLKDLPLGTNSVHLVGINGSPRVYFFNNTGFINNYREDVRYTSSNTVATVNNVLTLTAGTPGDENNIRNQSFVAQLQFPVDGGTNKTVCDLDTTMNASGNVGFWTAANMWRFIDSGNNADGVGLWSLVSGPTTNVFFPQPNSPVSSVIVDLPGRYVFRWTLTAPPDGSSCVDSDIVTIDFLGGIDINAGKDTVVCGNTYQLQATDNGSEPDFTTSTVGGRWEYVPAAQNPLPNPTFSTNAPINYPNPLNDPNAIITVDTTGTYTLRWRVGNSGCGDFDNVRVGFVFGLATADVEPETSDVCGLTKNVLANQTVGIWQKISGPGTVTFGDSLSRSTTITVSLGGTYAIRWAVGIGQTCFSADTVLINFFEQPVAAAGRDTTVCGNVYGLQGNTLGSTTGQWTQVGGTTLTNPFADASNPNTNVTVPNTGGTYSFRWSLSSTGIPIACNAQDDVTVRFIPLPNVIEGLLTADSLAGPDVGYCALGGSTDAILPVDTDPTTTISGLWEYVSSNPVGLPAPTILDPTDPNTGITATQGGTYTFRWTVTVQTTGQGGSTILCPQSGEMEILLIDVPGGPNIAPINAGTDQAQVCGTTPNHTTTLSGSVVPSNYTGTWSVSNNPTDKPTGSTTVFTSPSDPNTNVNVNLPGIYKFVWTNSITVIASDGKSYTCGVSDTVSVTFVAIPDANPGKDTLVCALNYQLQANLPIGAIGNTPTPTTGVWTVVPGAPGTVTFSPNATTPNATATVDVEGEYNLIWTLSLGTCTDDDTLTVDFVIPPTPNAGLNQVRCEFTTTLAANSTATQLAGTVGTWSIVSQPTGGGATNTSFSNINDPLATFTIASKVAGNYNLRWTFARTYDGQPVCPVFDDVTIQFDPTPVANAGADQEAVCATPGTTVLGATATANSTGAWSLLSTVPNGLTVNFGDVTNPTTSATFSAAGTYNLVWRVQGNQDASCFNRDTVRIVVTPPLTTTVTDVVPLCGLTTVLTATTTPTNLQTGQWTASPATGVVFTSPTTPNTSVTVPGTGNYTFTWTTGNGICTASDNTVIDFSEPIVGASVTPIDQALYINKPTTATASVTSPSSVTYTWTVISGTLGSINLEDINKATPRFNPTEDSEYEVTIRSGNSCVETRRIKIRVISEIYVPNVFTPNGDGLYDTWIIRELDGFPNATVKVFNRWGDLVFENKGAYTKPWDGTYNGKSVGTATFYYVIDKGENVPAPDKREIKGSVTVTY